MTPEQKALARDLVRWRHWEWGGPTAGALVTTTHPGGYPPSPAGVLNRINDKFDIGDMVAEDMFGAFDDDDYDEFWKSEQAPLPELGDAATKGAILGLLRCVRDDPFVSCVRVSGGWAVWAFPLGVEFQSTRIALEDTEDAALVAACLATE